MLLKRIAGKIKRILVKPRQKLDETGERVDIAYSDKINYEQLDMYQKSHYKRYEYAVTLIEKGDVCGDFACGTGYGSIMLAKKADSVVGADINKEVVKAVKQRYRDVENVKFYCKNILSLDFVSFFYKIVSFETIEHFAENDIKKLLHIYYKALKPGGKLIFSTPYMQENTEPVLKMGHHLTFFINEEKIEAWLKDAGFVVELYKYQNYDAHELVDKLELKHFVICIASKIK